MKILAGTASILAAAVSVAASGIDPAVELGLVESARVEVVEGWPFVVEGDSTICSRLGPDAVRVTENGREVEVIAVDPALPRVTHVLMLDTSASMADLSRITSRKKGRQTKAAAKAYVDWMLEDAGGPDETLMVFTFDDDLLLRNARTAVTDRGDASRLHGDIDRISGGYHTMLSDSVVRLARLLGSLPEHAVVILLSDGADNGSSASYEDVERVLREANNVTLFPIGVGLPDDRFQRFLETLAEVSGGKYYWIRSSHPSDLGGPLQKRFRDIRERVRSQLYVSWVAEPLGAPGEKPADTRGNVRREVRIHSLDDRCKVPRDGYRPERNLGRRGLPAGAPAPLSSLAERAGRPTIRVSLADLALDSEPLLRYDGDPTGAVVEERTVEILLSPLVLDARSGAMTPEPRAPEDVVHQWLLDGLIPETRSPGKSPRVRQTCFPTPHEMNGSAFLDQRDRVARAIFDRSPELRAWAVGRLRTRLRAQYAKHLPDSADPAMREQILDSIVQQRMREVSPIDYMRDLAGWYRDVPARELAFDVERKEANLLLDGGASGQEVVDRIQDRWVRLHDWLGFPDRARVVTPLEPIYDPEGDALAFFRIALPRLGDLPEDPDRPRGKLIEPVTSKQWIEYEKAKVTAQPFGILSIRWLLALPPSVRQTSPPAGDARRTLARELEEHWRVTALNHEPLTIPAPARNPLDPPPAMPACREDVWFDLRPAESGPPHPDPLRLRLVVDFDMQGKELKEPTEKPIASACRADATVTGVAPQCFTTTGGESGARARLAELLGRAGVAECGGRFAP
jgi:hypothetical protein